MREKGILGQLPGEHPVVHAVTPLIFVSQNGFNSQGNTRPEIYQDDEPVFCLIYAAAVFGEASKLTVRSI